jgi:hypothetical protein
LPKKPLRIVDPDIDEVSDLDGYLMILEGQYTSFDHPYVDENGIQDLTVGDVDDIIGFTAVAHPAVPFRGLINGKIEERNAAEIVWFVRGNTLYRRVRLLADNNHDSGETLKSVARREKRVIHQFYPPSNPSDEAAFIINSITNQFPYPLYDPGNKGWYYLRMPILEEILSKEWDVKNGIWQDEPSRQWKTIPIPSANLNEHPDLWEKPHFIHEDFLDKKSGALKQYVDLPRNTRAGEDVVLTNVLSFDVKIWCPTKNDFVDLGTQGTYWDDDNNKQPNLPRTWDSWTREYEKESNPYPPYYFDNSRNKALEAIQVTIRCFDPSSRVVKQATVVHRFK